MPLSYKANAQMLDVYFEGRSDITRALHLLISSHQVAYAGDDGGLSWMELYLLVVALTPSPHLHTH
eukprot:12319242-Karenia_brevis.AAC.1